MATIGGALRSVIVAANLPNVTVKVGRDIAPDSAGYPFITFTEDISAVPKLMGSRRVMARTHLLQVDLWQKAAQEDDTLIGLLVNAIDTATLTGAGTVFRVRVRNWHRMYESKTLIVHHAITVMVDKS